MSDRKNNLTPIIVGAVIALLGILVGLYFAVNAREQLAAASTETETPANEAGVAASDTDAALPSDAATALPDLPAVDDTPAIESEETEPLPDEPVVETPPVTTVDDVPAVPAEVDVPDDFEEVTPEELEKAVREHPVPTAE